MNLRSKLAFTRRLNAEPKNVELEPALPLSSQCSRLKRYIFIRAALLSGQFAVITGFLGHRDREWFQTLVDQSVSEHRGTPKEYEAETLAQSLQSSRRSAHLGRDVWQQAPPFEFLTVDLTWYVPSSPSFLVTARGTQGGRQVPSVTTARISRENLK